MATSPSTTEPSKNASRAAPQIIERPDLAPSLTDLDPVLARVYRKRGVRSADELELGLARLLPGSSMLNLPAAADRLIEALERAEHIVVVGDFDADGATASSVLMSFLRSLGHRELGFLVPNRFDFGYGLTPPIVDIAAADGARLIVTVDNGIGSIAGVERARELGIDVVVTDHHLPGRELPEAIIVNPNQVGCEFPSKMLAGVGVAFYLAAQTRAHLRERGWFQRSGVTEPNLAELLDLVALGTVADVVPLDHNNRILIEQGLRRMRAGQARPGIAALLRIAGRAPERLTSTDLAFAVAPRLNAAGRLQDMSIGIRCLLSENMSHALELASALDELNASRRAIEADMVAEATAAAASVADDERSGLALYEPSWHQGVVGIVAGRIRERFHRPVIAFADAGDSTPDELKGSGRSVEGFHLRDALDAVDRAHPGLIQKFGGHAMAAGLTIKRVHVERFATAFDRIAGDWLTDDDLEARVVTDGALSLEELTFDSAMALRKGGPWGQRFEEPRFDNVFEVVSQRTVGERHEKLVLKADGAVFDGIYFNYPYDDLAGVGPGSIVRCVYRLDVNEYRGKTSLQLMVEQLQAID